MIVIVAILTGLAVAGVTVIADRCGQKIGGFMATVPVTSVVGVILVLQSAHSSLESNAIIVAGNYSVIASFVAIAGYIATIQYSGQWTTAGRVALAEVVFFFLYVGGILLCRRWLPLGNYLFLVDAVEGVCAYLLLRLLRATPVPPRKKLRYTPQELLVRFASGFLAIGIIKIAATRETIFAGALSVFPGVFATSLGVMGMRQSPEFSAAAARAGIFGVLAIALFIGGYRLWASQLYPPTSLILTCATLTALMCYFLGLVVFQYGRGFLHKQNSLGNS